MNMRFSADDMSSRTLAIIEDLKHLEGPLLPILHAVQDAFGYVPDEIKPIIARELNLSRAEVHGVVSFYHDYRHRPAGRHVLKLCQAEACQSVGSEALTAFAKSLLGVGLHETTADGAFTVEPVYCLGLCACAPALMLDGEIHGRVDADCLAELISEARR